MSHNSEVDIDYESLPIGAGQYLLFFPLLSVQVSSWWVLLVNVPVLEACGSGWVQSWRRRESGRTEVPHTSPSGGPWASYSGARPAILDLDLHLDLPQFDIHLAIILSSILSTSKHVHPGPHTRTDLAMSTELRQLSRHLYHSSVLTVARTRWGEERKHPCQ